MCLTSLNYAGTIYYTILVFYNLNLLDFPGFTLALFKDTNWYDRVDDSISDPIFWGKDIGCEFLEGAYFYLETLLIYKNSLFKNMYFYKLFLKSDVLSIWNWY